ncbi:cobalamin-binding protein [Thiomicrorhabdus indica]|uniref:cobalamin-binding protein n=1 Tax=Thiomicrorhabdus indica TaxID=2267253 RepID=UPI0013EE6228|nr:cobalamin-binding protein [Thiomicrorhabdus indica]
MRALHKTIKLWFVFFTYFSVLSLFVNTAKASLEELPIQNAQRIISLAPHLTEMVYSAGAGDKLIGVVNYSDYPEKALSKPIIGSYNSINIESIIQLKPDLILTWRSGNRSQDSTRLKELQTKLGFVIWESDIETLEDIPVLIQSIGKMAGTQVQANSNAESLQTKLKSLRMKYSTKKPIKTFYQIWNNPLITMGKKQFISQGIEVCGGKNIFDDLGGLTGPVSIETVILRNPDILLMGGRKSFQQEWLKTWEKYPQINAVKHNQIHLLNNNLYQRPTARFINALEPLCKVIDSVR